MGFFVPPKPYTPSKRLSGERDWQYKLREIANRRAERKARKTERQQAISEIPFVIGFFLPPIAIHTVVLVYADIWVWIAVATIVWIWTTHRLNETFK